MLSLRKLWIGSCCFAGLITGTIGFQVSQAQDPNIKTVSLTKNEIRIGMPKSIFRNVPQEYLAATSLPFNRLVQDQTGMPGQVTHDKDYESVAEKLNKGDYHIAVFLGHEYAWAKKKYPNLQPLVKAVPLHKNLQAFLIVRYDSKAKSLSDLKDGNFAIPDGYQDHAMLYCQQQMERQVGKDGFSKTTRPKTIEEALYDVIKGDCCATVADSAAWKYFKDAHPGVATNLRILSESEVFPLACIAYNPANVKGETVTKVKNGLIGAANNPVAKPILRMIKLSGFEAIHDTYEEECKKICEVYPETSLDVSKWK